MNPKEQARRDKAKNPEAYFWKQAFLMIFIGACAIIGILVDQL